MAVLPTSIQQYFDALIYGFEELLPQIRIKNRDWLLTLYDALCLEPLLSVQDLQHTKKLILMADHVAIPKIEDARTCCEAESVILTSGISESPKEIRHTLKWAYLLLARHGHAQADFSNVSNELLIWRIVQSFPTLEQGFWVGAIQWMKGRGFAARSILTILRESQKFTAWMAINNLDTFSRIDDAKLHRYILHRALGQSNAAKQKILAGLRAVLFFYKESFNGHYQIPMMTYSVLRDRMCVSSASSKEILDLWDALQSGQLSAMAGMMLLFK
jgi:hypothetical protein